MIYTVTFNPSLDYVVHMDHFAAGTINRAEQVHIYPGGKGINVALVLGSLHMPARMLGFTAGFTGREIERLCRVHGGDCAFLQLDAGTSRINVKISADGETAVNGQGPDIPADKLEQLLNQIRSLQDGDTLVLAGSIPSSLRDDIYRRILELLQGRSVRTVVDATGSLLKKVLPYHPFLIKPNQDELGGLFHKDLQTEAEIAACAKEVQALGARNILVSRGGDGALLLSEDGRLFRSAARGKLVNSVGAGDSMVAGFLTGYDRSGGDYGAALKLGTCAGSATAFRDWLATEADVNALLQQMA